MIAAIIAHLGIGVGALVCQKCGQKFCHHKIRGWMFVAVLLLGEATASVLLIG